MMKVFVAGATGVLGRALGPMLLEKGHTVRALVRSPEKALALVEAGAELVAGDLLSRETQVRLPEIVEGCQAVLHLATSIPSDSDAPGAWDANTRLRTEGTRALLDASLGAGVERYIQQSIIMAYIDGGDRWLDESTPLDTSPRRARTCGPVIQMEGMVREVPPERMVWCILRGGAFVGPGTAQDVAIRQLKEDLLAVACDGSNYISPVKVADMARAVVAALEKAPGGSTFNVVDEPLREGEYADRLAALLGLQPPPRDPAVPCPPSFRCSNQAARRVLGWEPVYGIWPKSAPEK